MHWSDINICIGADIGKKSRSGIGEKSIMAELFSLILCFVLRAMSCFTIYFTLYIEQFEMFVAECCYFFFTRFTKTVNLLF